MSQSLAKELVLARKRVVTDGYEMSLGELISSYRAGEININPSFQRLYRWDLERKTRFIESLLLGIPTPPIFVYTKEDSTWELVDGLQRLSTVLEFVGELKESPNMEQQPLRLLATKLLPSLSGKSWSESKSGAGDGLLVSQQLDLRRSRVRLEILAKESDEQTKYELFQRLNTGGATLSHQEVRNCVLIMVNPEFYERLERMAGSPPFKRTVRPSERKQREQLPMELALRFVAFTELEYEKGLGVHEFLDDAALGLSDEAEFDHEAIEKVFNDTFAIIDESLGEEAFKAYRNGRFQGSMSIAAYEVISVGIAENLDAISTMTPDARRQFVVKRTKKLWEAPAFNKHQKAGVPGSRRLASLLPIAHKFFAP